MQRIAHEDEHHLAHAYALAEDGRGQERPDRGSRSDDGEELVECTGLCSNVAAGVSSRGLRRLRGVARVVAVGVWGSMRTAWTRDCASESTSRSARNGITRSSDERSEPPHRCRSVDSKRNTF